MNCDLKLGDSISDETESTQIDTESMASSIDEEEDGNNEVSSPSGDEHDNVISEKLSNQIPLQRIAMSVRYKKNRGSKILRGGWMVHFTNTDRMVRMFFFPWLTSHKVWHSMRTNIPCQCKLRRFIFERDFFVTTLN